MIFTQVYYIIIIYNHMLVLWVNINQQKYVISSLKCIIIIIIMNKHINKTTYIRCYIYFNILFNIIILYSYSINIYIYIYIKRIKQVNNILIIFV